MSGFGDKLRRSREMRGVTLEEIAESTKIGTRSLRALEDEDFEKLPGGVFNRGFVRAYSRFLGLDEEETVADFDAAWKAHEAAKAPPPELEVEEKESGEGSSAVWLFVSAVVLLVVISAGWFLLKRQHANNSPVAPAAQSSIDSKSIPQQPQQPPTSAQTPPASGAAAGTSQTGTESTTAQTTNPTKPKEPEPKVESKTAATSSEKPQTQSANASDLSSDANAPIHLEVFAREDSWLSVSVDGKSLGQGILPAQKSRSIRAQREVHLRVGNVAGVEVSFNGRPIDIDGEPKQAKELIFTPDGLRQ